MSTISLSDMSCQDHVLKQGGALSEVDKKKKKMSPLFCSDLFAIDQTETGKKKHLLTLVNTTTLSASTDRMQRVFTHPDTKK